MTVFPESWSRLEAVFSHDWLTGMRGGERVLELLCQGFPRAPVCTLIHNRKAISPAINAHRVLASPLQHVPGIFGHYRYFLPLFPWAVSSIRTPPGELLLSTSHCIAKGLRAPPPMKHLCYCFTPMRYCWTFYTEYFGGNPVKKCLVSPLLSALREWDLRSSERVHHFVTLSRHVRDRIRRFYDREADVGYPPVNTEFFTPDPAAETEAFDLIVSALVPYKCIDIAVRAYTRLGYPLKIVGVGTETEKLRRLAGANVSFLGWQGDEAIRDLYRRCRCLVFPGEEDFGIVPVEAQACGRPVVAFGRGGALESIEENVTGVFFRDQTMEESLLNAVEECAGRKWDPAAIRRHAEQFAPQRFVDGLDQGIRRCLAS